MPRGKVAAALARATREVERQTRRGGCLSLMGLIEQYLAKRATHSAAIAAIDGELKRVYERLSEDRPAALTATPVPVDTSRQASRQTLPQRPSASSTVPPEFASRKTTSDVSQACLDAVLRAVAQGAARTREIRDAVSEHPYQRVKNTLQNLVERGILVRSGKTHSTRYAFAPGQRPKAAAPVPPALRDPRAVVDDGQEFEVVWKPGREAPSLLGDRETRADR